MSDETPEKVTPAEEAPQASEAPKETKPSPEYVSREDLETFGAELVEKIVPRLKQSQKDTIKANVASEVGKLSSFDEVVELLKPHLPEDLDVQGIKRNAYLDNLMSEKPPSEAELESDSPPKEKTPEPASSPPAFEAEIQTILETHGVKGDEPELLEYAEKNKGKPWYQIGQGFEDLTKTIAARSAGTSAGVVPSQGQAVTSDLVADFRKELAEGMKQGKKGMQYLRQLQQKYVEKGANIDDLDISPKGSIKTRDYLYRSEGPR